MPLQLPFFNFWIDGSPEPITVSDNTGNLRYDGLESVTFDLENCAYVRLTDQQVEHGADATNIVYGVLDASVKNERNQHKSRKLTLAATLQVDVVDYVLGSAWSVLQRFAKGWTITKSMEETGAEPTPLAAVGSVPSLTGSAEMREKNPSNWKQETIVVRAWQTLTTKKYDEELGVLITIVESVVLPSHALDTPTATSWSEQVQVDERHAILTTYTLASAWTRSVYETINYTFPALLASWDGNPANAPVAPDWTPGSGWVSTPQLEATNGRSVFIFYIQTRPAFSAPVHARIYEEIITAAEATTLLGIGAANVIAWGSTGSTGFYTTPLSQDLGTTALRANLYYPRPRDISYSGLMFGLNIPNVICDGDTLTATSHSSDTYYGPDIGESFTYPDSYPSLTDYLALIGDTVCIQDDITPWRSGLYKRRRVLIHLK